MSVILSQREFIFIIIAAIILHSTFKLKDVFSLSCILTAPLIFITEILAYWGLPFTTELVWFWGLPFLILSFAIVFFCGKNNRLPMMLTLAAGILLISNTFLMYHNSDANIKVVKIVSNSGIEGVSDNLLKNLSDSSALVSQENAIKDINDGNNNSKYLILLPSTPMINDSYLKANAKKGQYWLFAEHDNLGGFITPDSIFNADSFRRTSPWHAFRPVMTRTLRNAADRDPIYAGNIGCTLKNRASLYPLVWEYTPLGIPKFLAGGEFLFGKRFTYIGDSDVTVKFLVPFNANFLQVLFEKPDLSDFLKGVCLIFLVIISMRLTKKSMKILVILFIACWTTIALLPIAIASRPASQVDVSIQVIGDWVSPHIDSHYSSLPKALSQKEMTVAIGQPDRLSKISLLVIGYGTHELKHNVHEYSKRIIMLTPPSKLKVGNNLYTVNDVPLGELKREVFGATMLVPDARELFMNGRRIDWTFFLNSRTVIIGTNSPQHIKGIDSIVKK